LRSAAGGLSALVHTVEVVLYTQSLLPRHEDICFAGLGYATSKVSIAALLVARVLLSHTLLFSPSSRRDDVIEILLVENRDPIRLDDECESPTEPLLAVFERVSVCGNISKTSRARFHFRSPRICILNTIPLLRACLSKAQSTMKILVEFAPLTSRIRLQCRRRFRMLFAVAAGRISEHTFISFDEMNVALPSSAESSSSWYACT